VLARSQRLQHVYNSQVARAASSRIAVLNLLDCAVLWAVDVSGTDADASRRLAS